MSLQELKEAILKEIRPMEIGNQYDTLRNLEKWVQELAKGINLELKAQLSPGELLPIGEGLAGVLCYRVDERLTANFKPQAWDILKKHNRLAGYLVPDHTALKQDLEGGVIEPELAKQLEEQQDHLVRLYLVKEVVPHKK